MTILIANAWEWHTEDGESYWRSPGGTAIGCIDRRSNVQAAIPGGRPEGGAFFSYPDGATLPSRTLNLGSDLERGITAVERDGLLSILGITVRSGDKLIDVIRNSLLDPVNYDPAGLVTCKPLRGSRLGGVKCHLAGFGSNGLIINEQFSEAHVAMQPTLDTRHVDYRRQRVYADTLVGQDRDDYMSVLRKWNNYDSVNLFGVEFDQRVIPSGKPGDDKYINDGWEPRATTITDNFNRADEQLDAGSYVENGGSLGVVSNHAERNTSGTVLGYARNTNNLSGDAQYSQGDCTHVTTNRYVGCLCRCSTDATFDWYAGWSRKTNGDGYEIWKRVSGSLTNLSSTGNPPGSPFTLKLTVSGSDLELFDGGVSKTTASDMAITGNLQCGITISGADTENQALDNFEAGDLAAASTFQLENIERHLLRGTSRGLLRGVL